MYYISNNPKSLNLKSDSKSLSQVHKNLSLKLESRDNEATYINTNNKRTWNNNYYLLLWILLLLVSVTRQCNKNLPKNAKVLLNIYYQCHREILWSKAIDFIL